MNEIWKDIEGYDGFYQVSNLGRIRSIERDIVAGGKLRHYHGRILKTRITPNGYEYARFSRNRMLYIHRAVAMAFVTGHFNGAQVNHKDENRQNNRWDNLEWVTPKENINYGNCIEKIRKSLERKSGCQIEQYTTDGQFVATYPSLHSAAKSLNANRRNIKNSLDTHHAVKGYLFKRKK